MGLDDLLDRWRAGGGSDVLEGVRLREGGMRDYEALSEFHYLRAKPVTATRVLVLEREGVGVAERFGGGVVGCEVLGVLVESLPALSCVLREVALGGRYGGLGDAGSAARLLNQEVRCISRVVVHPQWRGLGLAVRLVRAALGSMTTVYTEALAAMGRVHPFFKKAGMVEYERPAHERDARLVAAMGYAGLASWELADVRGAVGKIAGLGERERGVLCRELGRWAGGGELVEQLGRARDRLMTEPRYYLKARGEICG